MKNTQKRIRNIGGTQMIIIGNQNTLKDYVKERLKFLHNFDLLDGRNFFTGNNNYQNGLLFLTCFLSLFYDTDDV